MDANKTKPKRGRGKSIRKEKIEEKENKRAKANKSDKIQKIEQVISNDENGKPTPPKRGRGRPKQKASSETWPPTKMPSPVNQADINRRKRDNNKHLADEITPPSSSTGAMVVHQPIAATAQQSSSHSQNAVLVRDDFEPPIIPLLGFMIHARRFAQAMDQERTHRTQNNLFQ